ncbi:hypothetical protein [Kitasatospora sp. DSM 101779]|uniref:hypothetical protein n=1 Tax=Kitasatospora sp. DSM 101779 TaxID=2853165 RepID=UPI0021D84C9A|nr:hypothetical protein [Kitasatospora sp. DSM 101779]MCU7821288.1 hypothetical protein [Kitasatospora sp. DSM 101779]
MKKTFTSAALTAALLAPAAVLAPAAPAAADPADSLVGAINAANDWNLTAAAVCLQELAVVPVGAAWTGGTADPCTGGTIVNDPRPING